MGNQMPGFISVSLEQGFESKAAWSFDLYFAV